MSNLFDLSGKNILVTGASSGIGREIAVRAWMQGANLVLTGRNEERLHETNAMLNGSGIMILADLTQEADLARLVKEVPALDGIVFNAGTIEYTPLKFISYQKIDNVFALNYSSQVMLTGQLIKHKKIKKGASLVYISSIASKTGVSATAVYASSKAAINAYMKVVAAELAGQKIRANSICPGLIRTPLLERADTIASETFAEAAKDYPLGIGEPVDVAGPTVFLLSDAAKWITGTEIIADGGLTIK